MFDEIGAEEADQIAYNAARTLRGTLHDAAKVRQQLQSCTKMLQKHQRKVDAVALEEMIQQAVGCWHLVLEDVTKAQQTLDQWNCSQRMEQRLSAAIRDARESAHLSKIIHEASSAGVKTQSAKKILKLMQSLEHAMQQLTERGITGSQFNSVMEEAETGGVSQYLISTAHECLENSLASQAQAKN